MKILILTSEYPPRGDTILIHSYAKEWVAEGAEVDVFFQCERLIFPLCYFSRRIEKRKPSGFPKKYVLDNVSVYKLPINKLYPGAKRSMFISTIYANLYLKKILKEKEYDIIVNHYCTKNHIFLKTIKKYSEAKILSVFHDCDINDDVLTKKIIENSNFIGARSTMIKNYLSKFCESKSLISIKSGIPDYMIDENVQESFRDNLVISYVGKLIKSKNVATILDAIYLLKDEHQFFLNIIGDGSELINLKKKVDEQCLNANFMGFLDRKETFQHLKSSSIFIMVSQKETFGLVYLEAMAAGNIVIGSKNEGIDGVIIDGENGFLVDAGDSKLLAEKIRYIMKLPENVKNSIVENAKKTANSYKETTISLDYLNQLRVLVDEEKIYNQC